MTPNRPYLIRAIHEWILDNDMTPHFLVDANMEGVTAPQQFVDDGKIVLNTSPGAINDLQLGNQWVLFSARFSGALFQIELPVRSVLAVYAKENGRGMVFADESEKNLNESAEVAENVAVKEKRKKKDKSHLKIIK